MVGPRQAADALVRGSPRGVLATDQGRHIGGVHILRPGIAMQGVGLVPAAHHLGIHLKQGVAMEGIGAMQPRSQGLGIAAGQRKGHAGGG